MCKILLPFLIILCNISFAQNTKRVLRLASEEGNGAYEEHDYSLALKNYLIVDSLTPDDAILSYRIGVCQRETYRFEEAIQSFADTKKNGYSYNDLNLMVAQTYHVANEFKKAETEYEKYGKGLDQSSVTYNEIKAENDQHIQQCQVGARLKANPLEITIQHLDTNINTEYAEYAPLISFEKDVLIYTSRKPTSEDDKADLLGLYQERIYSSRHVGNIWSNSKLLEGLNKSKNDAYVGLSPDGTQLILYRTNNLLGEAGDLYISELIPSKENQDSLYWSTPKSLGGHINSTSWEPSASLSEDNQTIYFTSNRPGGFGGTDIYVSKKVKGHWGKARNLGSTVNTKYDEDSPFINNEVLYFSSKGHEGMGGYDLFMSVLLFDEWLEPINFGYPINSAKDDFHFVWNTSGTRGYFSSVRKDSYGKSDIYVIIRPFDKPDMVYVKGTLTDEASQEPISSAQITLIDSLGSVYSEHTTDSLGKYKLAAEMGMSYQVQVKSDEYATVDYNIVVPKKAYYFEVTEDVKTITKVEEVKRELAVITEREKEQKNAASSEADVEFKTTSVYFEYNKSDLSKSTKSVLDKLAFQVKNTTFQVEISGHTDKVGNDNYNNRLAKERAQSVFIYLKTKGIDENRCKVISFGKKKPVSTQDDKNRRVEIYII